MSRIADNRFPPNSPFRLASVAGGFLFGKRGQHPAFADVQLHLPKAQLLEALGSLSASHLYQSYLNIGMLGDAVEKGGCSLAQANDMLATVVDLMQAVDQQLDKVASAGLSDEDAADVEQIQQLSVLLKMQVASLRVYWLTHDSQDAKRYQEAREKSWAALSDVLGLEQ
jgi:hypothetical protein